MSRGIGCLLLLLALAAAGLFLGRDHVRRHPQDVPWTRLEIDDPIGRFTPAKIAGLGDSTRQCRAMLAKAGTGDSEAPARNGEGGCGYDDGILLASGEGARRLAWRPAPLVTSCPVAVALRLWESRVVQPAARRRFGSEITAVRHAGSYSCRRIYGLEAGELSEHATADAVDITAFDLANGERVSVLQDWPGSGPKAEFLRDVRDGGCRIFSTVLSPAYNEAHRDHLHFDVARRGGGPWSYCR